MSNLGFTELLLVAIVLSLLIIPAVGFWKMYAKAGQPGIAALIPIWNFIALLEIVEKPLYWLFLMLVPFYNIYLLWQISAGLASKFGKDTAFAVGLFLVYPIFGMILGFDGSEYNSAPQE